ncbi:hypothetical protein DET57_11484 [Klebsiella oxytoca]|uniref:Uncharacterized protein n=1 Tax=Klebsiella oxytoca TaxID=571 RepID=A0A318FK18_KLEOX|nr:hypothetical protein DET57_11484 [Klebsiella oxytoca]
MAAKFYRRTVRKIIKQLSTENTLRLTVLITSILYGNGEN